MRRTSTWSHRSGWWQHDDTHAALTSEPSWHSVPWFLMALLMHPLLLTQLWRYRVEENRAPSTHWPSGYRKKAMQQKSSFPILSAGGGRFVQHSVRKGPSSSSWNITLQHLTRGLVQSELWVLIPSQGQPRAKFWHKEDTRKDAIQDRVY